MTLILQDHPFVDTIPAQISRWDLEQQIIATTDTISHKRVICQNLRMLSSTIWRTKLISKIYYAKISCKIFFNLCQKLKIYSIKTKENQSQFKAFEGNRKLNYLQMSSYVKVVENINFFFFPNEIANIFNQFTKI